MAQRSKWPVSFWKTKASIVALTWQVWNAWVTPSSGSHCRALCCSCPFWQCPQPTFETSDRDLLASASVQLWGRRSLAENPQNQKQKKMEITTAMELFERPIYDIWCSKTQTSCMNMVILSSLRPISTTCTGPSKPRGHHLDLAWARIYLTIFKILRDISRYFKYNLP